MRTTVPLPILVVVAAILGSAALSGCDQKSADRDAAGPSNSGSKPPAAPVRPVEAPTPADASDDALAPSCLPRSGAAGDWTKVEPVHVVSVNDLAGLVPADTAARLTTFSIKSAARCVYARPAGARLSVAEVLLIEAARAEDAYGLLTVQSSAAETESGGCRIRAEAADGLALHAWQGVYYLRLRSVDGDAESAAAMRKLLFNVASRIQREDLPTLLEALPTQSAISGKRWLVRRLSALPPDALGLSPSPDWQRIDDVLKLGNETLVAICQYEAPQARRPDTVWLISFPSVDAARDARARYARHLEQDDSRASESTSLLDPHGRFLVGTWTAEEESLLYILPRVMQLLPS